MNADRLARLAETVLRLHGPEAPEAAESEGERLELTRTNEPRYGWTRHADPASARIARWRDGNEEQTSFNLKVGWCEEGGRRIVGLSGLTIALFGEGPPDAEKTMLESARELLDLGFAGGDQIVRGANWMGEGAAWVTPEQCARALEAAAEGGGGQEAWRHVDRDELFRRQQNERGSQQRQQIYPWRLCVSAPLR